MRLLLLLALLLAACGGEPRQNDLESDTTGTDTVSIDTLDEFDDLVDADPPEGETAGGVDVPPSDNASGDRGGDIPRNQTPSQPGEGPTAETPATHTPWGSFRLVSVDGERLPVTLEEAPDCTLQLMEGTLDIRRDGVFDLSARSRRNCQGQDPEDEMRDAAGTLTRQGGTLRFEASDGQLFAAATGTLGEDGRIHVTALELEGEPSPVDWFFEYAE